jgi:hypothetical protein
MHVHTQAWVSPWQVAHVLSIVRTLQGDLAPAWQPAAARSRSLRPRRGSRLTYLTSAHLHFACTLDVPLVSAIVMVRLFWQPRWLKHGCKPSLDAPSTGVEGDEGRHSQQHWA